jgi:hypothetical protein
LPNSIKYSASAQTLALKKGNLWIGTGDVGKGPSATTGYYNGVTPAAGGYTIYSYSATQTGNLSYFSAANDAALIAETNRIAGTSYTTAAQCLTYFATQTDRMACNIDYPAVVTDGLVLNVDAGFTLSYPTTGTTWYDSSSSVNNGTLTNGPVFNTGSGGSIVFDGVDDYSPQTYTRLSNGLTLCSWMKTTSATSAKSYAGDASNNIVGDTRGTVWIGFGVTNGKVNYNNAKKTGEWSTSQYYSTASVNNGSWKYINVTHDKTTELVSLYVNGSLDSTFDNSSTGGYDQWADTAFNILCRGYVGDYFNGTIGVVQIYNRALSSAEVLQNFNSTKSRFGL